MSISDPYSPIQPPAWFTELIRDALNHLNDPAYLLGHRLNLVLADLMPEGAEPGQGLREILLDAIDSMEPPRGSTDTGLDRRPYLALTYRYVDGFPMPDVARRLHIGPRQCRRDIRRSVQALAILLWDRRGKASPTEPPPGDQAGQQSAVLAEVAALGVELERVPLAELLRALQAPAMALAERYQVELRLYPDEHAYAALCDRTLTREAVISCLGALLQCCPESAPRALSLKPAERAGILGLEIRCRPPIARSEVDSLDSGLAECRALLSAQGGNAALLPGDQAGCPGVWIELGAERDARILVVDDNEGMRQLYERYLSPGRFLLHMAASADEAEAALQQFVPDVIVLDVMMRGTDGWEFLQALRSRPTLRQTPVIVCSVLREPGLAAGLGAQTYLKKPITGEQLLEALAQALGWSSPGERPPGRQ
ncbi:MAG: response regulator [Anaerolineae bacterium]|nr:response regulator [Anaerolineae bacterium]